MATATSPLEALAAELGAQTARIERDLRRDFEAGMAQMREVMESVRREAAEMTMRALNAEHELREVVTTRLATVKDGTSVAIEDLRPVVEGEVARRLAEIPPPEPPDVAAAVSAQFDQRQDEIVARVAQLVPAPQAVEIPDIDGMVGNAVAAAFATVRVPKDGKDADPEATAALVRDAVNALPPVTTEAEQRAVIDELVSRAVSELPKPRDGDSVTVDDVRPLVESEIERQLAATPLIARAVDTFLELELPEVARQAAALVPVPEPVEVEPVIAAEIARRQEDIASRAAALVPIPQAPVLPDIAAIVDERVAEAIAALPPARDGEPGPPGPPGALPIVEEWVDRVYYQSEAVVADGRLYQAQRDTGHRPPHDDWRCIVSARDGVDGRSFKGRGAYSPDKDYAVLNVVGLNGCSFFALRDNPGPCPGEDWQLLSDRGRAGKPLRGDPGPPGPKLLGLTIDDHGMLRAVNEDGSIAECDLYPLLQRLER